MRPTLRFTITIAAVSPIRLQSAITTATSSAAHRTADFEGGSHVLPWSNQKRSTEAEKREAMSTIVRYSFKRL